MTVRFEADSEAATHRVEAWCGEPLIHEGEDIAVALASGTVRRRALDAALAEMDRGLPEPSFEWRRDYSLVLGLERVLAEPQPRLASGTTLRRHQVDALAGQLAALISDLERDTEPDEEDDDSDEDEPENGADSVEELASDAVEEDDDLDEDEEEYDDDEEFEDDDEDEPDADDGEEPAAGPPPPGPTLAHDPAMAVAPDDDALNGEEQAPDPGARRRYRFKHPTASGKTIAAAGFVEAARTTGVLILTHRRLLVSQFTSDLAKEGYGGRMHEPVLVGDPTPRTMPLTINTYAWFIKHADQIKPDVYGVVVCDEAHTALGE
jgi:ribonuclease E